MSVLDRLLPRTRWWRVRRHAVCVYCYKYGREFCAARETFRAIRLLEVWWWFTDAVVADFDSKTHAITARSRQVVNQPEEWGDNQALYERLFAEANVSREEWEQRYPTPQTGALRRFWCSRVMRHIYDGGWYNAKTWVQCNRCGAVFDWAPRRAL